MLLRSLITQTKSSHPNRLSLHVQATNSIALRFYQRFGFQKSIFKASYYSNQTLKASHHFRSITSSSTTSDSTTSSSLTSASSSSTSPSSASTSTSTSDDGLDEDSNSGRIIQEVDAWFLVLDLSTS
ncbi:hypothetical protein DFH28DRAFT_970099 [Melampsora americana]|nr:hypothetical protein DFH28DRAFT_970099 [Melampsora americana]